MEGNLENFFKVKNSTRMFSSSANSRKSVNVEKRIPEICQFSKCGHMLALKTTSFFKAHDCRVRSILDRMRLFSLPLKDLRLPGHSDLFKGRDKDGWEYWNPIQNLILRLSTRDETDLPAVFCDDTTFTDGPFQLFPTMRKHRLSHVTKPYILRNFPYCTGKNRDIFISWGASLGQFWSKSSHFAIGSCHYLGNLGGLEIHLLEPIQSADQFFRNSECTQIQRLNLMRWMRRDEGRDQILFGT